MNWFYHAEGGGVNHFGAILLGVGRTTGGTRLKGVNNTAQGNALGIRGVRAQALKGRQRRSRATGVGGDRSGNCARCRPISRPFRA